MKVTCNICKAEMHSRDWPGHVHANDEPYAVYAVPKYGDMSEGLGVKLKTFNDERSAESYVLANSSPDNPNWLDIRPESP